MYSYKINSLSLIQYFYNKYQNPLIRACINFNNHINKDSFFNAIDNLLVEFPILKCTFNKETLKWDNKNFTSKDLITIVSSSNSDSIYTKNYLINKIDPLHDPQLKIFLIRQDKKDSLVFIINHMICDGTGFKEYLYEICRLYNSNKKIEFSHENSMNLLINKFSLSEKFKIILKKKNKLIKNSDLLLPLKNDNSNAKIFICKIPYYKFKKIKLLCKTNNFTINDVLLTAYIRSLYKFTQKNIISIPCPMDMRKFLSKDKIYFDNLVDYCVCTIKVKENESFLCTLQKVSNSMKYNKVNLAYLKDFILLDFAKNILPKKIIQKLISVPMVSYTNLGIIDKFKLNFNNASITSAYITTAIKHPPAFQLSISTFNDECYLSCSSYLSTEDEVFIVKFLKNIISEITDSFI